MLIRVIIRINKVKLTLLYFLNKIKPFLIRIMNKMIFNNPFNKKITFSKKMIIRLKFKSFKKIIILNLKIKLIKML